MMNDDTPTFLYVISKLEDKTHVSPCKIGITKRLNTRLATIQTSCPFKVGIYQSMLLPALFVAAELEKAIHRVNAKRRLNGEWFDMSPGRAAFGALVALGSALNHFTDLTKEEIDECIKLALHWEDHTLQ